MSETQGYSEDTQPITERRAHTRRRALPLAYVDLGENNGGIVLNISAGGLAFAAAAAIREENLPRMRFQLPQSNVRVEASGQIAWTGDSKKEAGVRFVELTEEAAAEINNWLSSEAPDSQPPARREDARTSARQPFRTMMATEPAATKQEPATPRPAVREETATLAPVSDQVPATPQPAARPAGALAERPVEAPIRGHSFTAALRKTKASIAVNPPVQSTRRIEAPGKAQARPILTAGLDLEAPPRRWWALTALISLFAVISFVAGMAAGGGGWVGVLSLLSRKAALASEPAQVVDAASQGATEGVPAPAADSAAKQAVSGTSSNIQDPSAAPHNSVAIQSPSATTPAVRTGHAPLGESAGLLLQMPESPVSASSSVAVTSRRSIQVAPESATQTAQKGQNVQIGQLSYRVEPLYPPDAERQRIEGTVELHATVGQDGRIRSVQALGGPPQLADAAANAIREWRYKPSLLNGQPIESEVIVKITYRLPAR